jgi:hypothetical protein
VVTRVFSGVLAGLARRLPEVPERSSRTSPWGCMSREVVRENSLRPCWVPWLRPCVEVACRQAVWVAGVGDACSPPLFAAS